MFSRFLTAAFAVLAITCASSAQAQNLKGFKPTGINGSAGAGFATWAILEPQSSNFRMDQGQFAAMAGEKGFGILNMYLNFSLTYLSGTGQVNYKYVTLSGDTYTGNDINFKMELFQAGLGLKIKLIDGYWIRPYVEGGGYGGWFAIKYEALKTKVTSTPIAGGTNYKQDDSLLDFGRYAEGGLEISFSSTFGLRPAARFIESETKQFKTLDDKIIKYQAAIYYLALLVNF